MIRQLIILATFLLIPLQAAAAVLVDFESSEGDLHAHLLITSATLLQDKEGQPYLTAADQLLCTLTVTAPEKMEVNLPSFPTPNFGDFTLLDQGETKTRRTSQGLEHERQWLVEPYNPGPYQLPELLIRATQGMMSTELILPRPEVTAHEIKVDGEELDDILPPQAPKTPVSSTVLILGAVLIILALAIWAGMRLKNKGPKPLPPQKRALLEIDGLAELSSRAKIEGLVRILRCYLDSRFELRCCEQTYDEYAPDVTGCKEIPKESRVIFLDILKRSDLIKFSNIDPQPGEAENMIDQAREALSACPLAEPDDKVCGRW